MRLSPPAAAPIRTSWSRRWRTSPTSRPSTGVRTSVQLRSGAYVIHDDGFYAGISPLIPGRAEHPLRSAMHGWARTVSRPEPELAVLDAGKRALPFDEGLPVPQWISGAEPAVLEKAEVTALNDQHAFLRLPCGGPDDVPV